MTGTILIADALATNRIILSAALSAAFDNVLQAAGGEEAIRIARRHRPDLLLVGGDLPDMPLRTLIASLTPEGRPDEVARPVVALMPQEAREQRLQALEAGATDVIGKPFSNGFLRARLRSILRQGRGEADFGLPAETADALGFADEPASFLRPQRIAIVAAQYPRAAALRDRLAPQLGGDVVALGADGSRAATAVPDRADAIVLDIGPQDSDTGLSRLADLQAAPTCRHARIVALLAPDAAHLAVPMLDMGVNDAVPCPVDDREIALRLSAQLAGKRQDDTLRDKLETGLQAAIIDPLTGLHNRRYGLSFLKRMIARAQQSGQTCAVMVADLDHFKSVNDSFGHTAGDTVLATISARLKSGVPAEAMIARIGGEEFLVAVPDTSPAAARRLARRLCHLVREAPVGIAGGKAVPLTVSIGVALNSPKAGEPLPDAEALVTEADHALYASKSGGRNTVTFCRRSAA